MYQISSQSQGSSWNWDAWFSPLPPRCFRPHVGHSKGDPKCYISETALKSHVTIGHLVMDCWTNGSISVFSTVCMSWAGWDQRTGRRSQTGGWRGRSPACGSSPPWRWYGSNRRRRLWCSTAPTRRPPPAAWQGRRGGSTAAGQVHKLSATGVKQDRPTFQLGT